MPPLLHDILRHKSQYASQRRLDAKACDLLLMHDVARYEDEIAKAFRAEEDPCSKFLTGVALTRVNPDKYQSDTRRIGREMLASDHWGSADEKICQWLTELWCPVTRFSRPDCISGETIQ